MGPHGQVEGEYHDQEAEAGLYLVEMESSMVVVSAHSFWLLLL